MPNLELLECPHFVGFEQNLGSQKFDRISCHLTEPRVLRLGQRWVAGSSSFISKMVAMLQIPRVFPYVSCLGSAKAVQCSLPGTKIGDKSQQIPRYSPVCPRGHPPGWPFISAFKPRIATVNSCFDLVGSRQHGIASNKVISWLTDHPQCRWRWPNETQIFADCETRDKGQQENPEHHVVASIRRLRTDKNYPAEKSWLNHV